MSEAKHISFPRCVVLTPESRLDTARSVIKKHELQAIIMHDPALAMAELALMYQEANSTQAWKDEPQTIRLVLIHSDTLPHLGEMLTSVKKYFHNISLFELREGRISPMQNTDEVVDKIVDPPLIQSESVDADELSMLLDGQTNEVDES